MIYTPPKVRMKDSQGHGGWRAEGGGTYSCFKCTCALSKASHTLEVKGGRVVSLKKVGVRHPWYSGVESAVEKPWPQKQKWKSHHTIRAALEGRDHVCGADTVRRKNIKLIMETRHGHRHRSAHWYYLKHGIYLKPVNRVGGLLF